MKEELRKEAFNQEFSFFGVPKLEELEKVPFPAHRSLAKPSEIMPEVKSVAVLGFHTWDIAMNTVVASVIPPIGSLSTSWKEPYTTTCTTK